MKLIQINNQNNGAHGIATADGKLLPDANGKVESSYTSIHAVTYEGKLYASFSEYYAGCQPKPGVYELRPIL
jgi:hypothetical protein